ncbi:hypothetical protein ALC62_00606 [Cyphomyrmex costatus]|uniref:Uncharacterized protein n=1 Tax=Cyphomyrmex costatus TaxID=456900 RepID=A0A151IQH2_9HYME|nr:hypothetical protein ALC62_00606 [Cyphomyrmex costatus]
MAPQGLSHSVSIPRAAAHAVPSRERGLSNRWSGEARCRQLSAVRGERAESNRGEKVEAKARRQEMEEKEVREGMYLFLKRTTTELKVVAFTVGSHITTSSHSLIRPRGFSPRWVNERTRAIH